MVNLSGSPSSPSLLNLEEGLKEAMTEGIMYMADVSTILMECSLIQIRTEDTLQIEDVSDLSNHLENSTKVLIQNVLEYQASHSTKTKSVVLNVKNLATCRRTVWNWICCIVAMSFHMSKPTIKVYQLKPL